MLEFISADNEKSVIQNGHILSMSNAASQISSIAATNDLTSGFSLFIILITYLDS